tara:strand:+ start:1554 stop:2036 length:483 start_codon:yes stop_codon:yes gene_type:complete
VSCLQKETGYYRSIFEKTVCSRLEDNKVQFEYESLVIPYVVPELRKTYTPDIVLSNGIIIELKGQLTREDRAKHLLIKKQRPDLDIRFLLQNCKNKLYKTSKTTYGDWLTNNNFIWAERFVPVEWIDERPKEIDTTNLFVKAKPKPNSFRPFTRYGHRGK